MAWISVHDHVDGKKLRRLSKMLDCSKAEALGVLNFLWFWGSTMRTKTAGSRTLTKAMSPKSFTGRRKYHLKRWYRPCFPPAGSTMWAGSSTSTTGQSGRNSGTSSEGSGTMTPGGSAMKEQRTEKTPKRDNRPSKPRRSRKQRVSPPAEPRRPRPKETPGRSATRKAEKAEAGDCEDG